MTITTLNPHDATSKTSIVHALASGYQITQSGDGCAQIISPNGDAYHVHDWECDCPDAFGRNGGNYELPDGRRVCKHVLWVSQLYPCQCGSTMTLNIQAGWKVFECTLCGQVKAACAVKTERRQAYRQTEQQADVEKTVQVKKPVIDHEKAQPVFESRYGIYIQHTAPTWTIYQAGFPICSRHSRAEAVARAEELEVLEALHHDRRRKSNVA